MNAWAFAWLIFLKLLHQSLCDDGKREVMVKEVVLDSAVVDIVYLGKNHECILVTSKSKRLYFSEDSGQNWLEVTGKIDSGDIQVERIIVNPSDKTVAVLQTQRAGVGMDKKRYPYIYITEDSGRTWRRAWGKKQNLHSWIFHTKERTWALVSWWAGDCDGETKSKKEVADAADDPDEKEDAKAAAEPCSHRLMVTRDLGRTFTQVGSYVVQFSWGSDKLQQGNRIYFSSYRSMTGDQGRLSLWTKEVDFNYIDLTSRGRPSGKVSESMRHGNKFLVSNEYILVAKVKDEVTQTVSLMVSSDGAKTFRPALLPSGMGELEEKWYTVLDTSEGAVILHINSNTAGIKDTGRIFVSDAGGSKFAQSLVDNVRSPQGECEFDKVISLQGVYMANVVVPKDGAATTYKQAAKKRDEEVEGEAADGAEVDRKHGRGGKKAGKPAKEERIIRTVLSFDKGAAWSFLKPPRVDSLGKPYPCNGRPAEECSLHLHGTTSWDFYAPFYSIETAVGIIMGTGNVGNTLRFEPEETNTFLSRDGGLTWMEAHKGAFIYEFGDHGGLIVMADDLKKTTEVVFSWNEGQSWFDFRVSKTPFEVDNIITEPNVTATTFVMFGTREEGEGVLYYMKFDSLQFPACRGVWAADSVSSDYETWTPSDGASTEAACMLGQQVSYTRRKRTSQCWNGEMFERPVVQKKCACTQIDFACEIGFVRKLGSQECTYGGQDMMPTAFVPTSCSGTWLTDSYRKVPGDQCEGGWSPGKSEVPCPSTFGTGSTSKWSLLTVLVLGLLFIGYTKSQGGEKGPAQNFTWEVSADSKFTLSNPMLPVLNGMRWLHAKATRSNEGFGGYGGVGYKKVQGNDFDLDSMAAGNEDSLTDFIDEAEHDDFAPPIYDGSDNRKETKTREATVVSGGAHTAMEAVPRLQAPPAAAIGAGSGDDELL